MWILCKLENIFIVIVIQVPLTFFNSEQGHSSGIDPGPGSSPIRCTRNRFIGLSWVLANLSCVIIFDTEIYPRNFSTASETNTSSEFFLEQAYTGATEAAPYLRWCLFHMTSDGRRWLLPATSITSKIIKISIDQQWLEWECNDNAWWCWTPRQLTRQGQTVRLLISKMRIVITKLRKQELEGSRPVLFPTLKGNDEDFINQAFLHRSYLLCHKSRNFG